MTVNINGSQYSDDGVLQTSFLGSDPVPGEAVLVRGIAHDADGIRYVTDEGPDLFVGGVPLRDDGAMSIAAEGTPETFLAGTGLTSGGKVAATEDPPETYLAGAGLTSDGRLCVSEAS